jgi:GST-like protein
MNTYLLHGAPGWGSALVEAQLDWYGLPYRLVDCGDLFADDAARARLRPLNPVVQVPTLVLPDGQVMTESAAITLHLADITGSDELVPGAHAPERAAFLRWLVFMVANIYPTFTYADDPARFVTGDEAAHKAFRGAVDAHAQRLWVAVEAAAATPWFLGARLSALDIYLGVMTNWRPRRAWFAEHTPKVNAAALAAAAHPRLAACFARNFKPAA